MASFLVLVVMASGVLGASHATYPLGAHGHYFTDPDCPGNPDSYEWWVTYSDGSEAYGGTWTYYCNGEYKNFTLTDAFYECEAYYGGSCPSAGHP